MHSKFLSENIGHAEDLGIYGKTILEWILRKQDEKCGLDCI